MSKWTLQEYLNKRIADIKHYIEVNERENDKDFFAHKELELYQMAQKYMQLTNDLGCPLEVVFKALKYGCHIQYEGYFDSHDIYFHLLEKGFVIGWGNKNNMGYEYLKDYKKTWWLVSDKENE